MQRCDHGDGLLSSLIEDEEALGTEPLRSAENQRGNSYCFVDANEQQQAMKVEASSLSASSSLVAVESPPAERRASKIPAGQSLSSLYIHCVNKFGHHSEPHYQLM